MPHTPDCRARIMTRLAEDNLGHTMLAEKEARVARRMAQGFKARDEGNIYDDEHKRRRTRDESGPGSSDDHLRDHL